MHSSYYMYTACKAVYPLLTMMTFSLCTFSSFMGRVNTSLFVCYSHDANDDKLRHRRKYRKGWHCIIIYILMHCSNWMRLGEWSCGPLRWLVVPEGVSIHCTAAAGSSTSSGLCIVFLLQRMSTWTTLYVLSSHVTVTASYKPLPFLPLIPGQCEQRSV